MKHAAIGFTLAVLAALPMAASAADPQAGGAAGNVDSASTYANGNIAIIGAIGLGAATALAVAVAGTQDDGNGTTATATATATTP